MVVWARLAIAILRKSPVLHELYSSSISANTRRCPVYPCLLSMDSPLLLRVRDNVRVLRAGGA